MRTRLAAVVLAAAFCAGSAVAAGEPAGLGQPLVLRVPTATSPLLGLDYGRRDTWLVRLDPTSLKILRGRKLALGRYANGWGFSPDRHALAVGNQPSGLNDSPAGIRIIDTAGLRPVHDVDLGITGFVAAIHWVQADRLLAVVRSCCPGGDSVAVVDPVAGRLLGRRELSGTVAAVAEPRERLVLLLEQPSYGPVQLVAVDPSGQLRSVTLDQVEAGVRTGPPPDSLLRAERAGLTVDSDGGRAYALAAGSPVAEVDLTSLSVAYHTVAQPVSFFARLHDWLEPVAQAKGPWVGSARYAVWLGDGRLAIFGRDGSVLDEQSGRGARVAEWTPDHRHPKLDGADDRPPFLLAGRREERAALLGSELG